MRRRRAGSGQGSRFPGDRASQDRECIMRMRKLLIMAVYIVSGVIGAWIGYWVGHALGWSTNAAWPWSIGTGRGAILLAFGMSVLFIVAAAVLLTFSSGRRVRQALDFGLPARASVLSIEKTGDQSTTPDGTYDQVRCAAARSGHATASRTALASRSFSPRDTCRACALARWSRSATTRSGGRASPSSSPPPLAASRALAIACPFAESLPARPVTLIVSRQRRRG